MKKFETGLKESELILQEWKTQALTGRLAFHKLRDHLNDFLKHLSKRYDTVSGPDYLLTVAVIYKDGYINDDDIKGLSDEARREIERFQIFWKEDR